MLLKCGVGEDLRVPWTDRRSNQSIQSPGCLLEGMMLKLKLLIIWPPDAKSWLIRKDPEAGKDWRQEEKGMTEDEMIWWHYRLNGHGFGWTTGVGDGQGGLACCGSWGHKESDTTERLNWSELNWSYLALMPEWHIWGYIFWSPTFIAAIFYWVDIINCMILILRIKRVGKWYNFFQVRGKKQCLLLV